MSVRWISKVLEESAHSGTELLVLLVLADYSHDDGTSYPGIPALARKCRMSGRNVNYILNALKASGELAVFTNQGPKGTNRYRIVLPVSDGQPLQPGSGLKAASPLKDTSPLNAVAPLKPASSTPEAGFPEPLKPTSDEPSLNRYEPSEGQKPKLPTCPHEVLKSLYHEALPELPAVRMMGAKRKEALTKFWKFIFTEPRSNGTPRAETVEQAIEWSRGYFERARDNDFVMGRAGRTGEHSNWQCSLDYLLTERGMSQVIEKTAVPA